MANALCFAGVNSIYAPQTSSNYRSATATATSSHKNPSSRLRLSPISACRNLQPVRAQRAENGQTKKTKGILRLKGEGNGREGIPWREGIGNPLGRTSFDSKISTIRGTACKKSSFVTLASMLGRKAKKREVVIPDPDYRIPVILLGIAGVFAYQDNLLPAATAGLLGLLLLFQTTRVRFVFDDEALEVRVGDDLQESGENVFVGGKNRWKYSTFVNWELWWPNFPILVYFKERQTKPDGQVHFFPVIFNGQQLYDVLVERAGPSKTSGPK